MLKNNTYRLLRKKYDAPFEPYTSKGKKYIMLTKGNDKFSVPYDKYITAVEKIVQYKNLTREFNTQRNYEIFEKMIEQDMNPTKKQINKYIKLLAPTATNDQKNKVLEIVLTDGTVRFLTLSTISKEEISNILLMNFVEYKPHTSYGSDAIEEILTKHIKTVKVVERSTEEKTIRNAQTWMGDFFTGINTTENIDLSRYQIYNESNYPDEQKHCIIQSLESQGVTAEVLTQILTSFQDCYSFPISKLSNLASAINQTIHLYTFRHDKHKKIESAILIKKYEPLTPNTEPLKLALYKNHYFIYENSIYSKYSIEHYEEVKEEKDFNDIIKMNQKRQQYERSKKGSKISSLQLVRLMDELKMFDWNNNKIQKTRPNEKIDQLNILLTNIKAEQTYDPNPPKKPKTWIDERTGELVEAMKPTIIQHIFYADLETVVKDGTHKPFMSGIIKRHTPEHKILITMANSEDNKDWFYKMMDYVIKKTPKFKKPDFKNEIWDIHVPIVFYHNLKYDLHMMMKYIKVTNSCKKDGQYYQYTIKYKGQEIILRDSYKMINVALSKFKNMFKLESGKEEAINYTFYDFENINKINHSVEEYKAGLNEKDKKIFDTIMLSEKKTIRLHNPAKRKYFYTLPSKYFNYDGVTFNAVQYYKYYLVQDVLTMREGLDTFNNMMKKITWLDSYNYMTISRLAFEFFNMRQCWEGVAYCKGNLREYLSNAVYGGRVHVNESIKGKILDYTLNDYDANGLYPSAFFRMCEEGNGLAKGFAKAIEEQHKIYENIKTLDYYVVTVKITKINKKQKNPFIQIRNDGISDYVNELPMKDIKGELKEQPIITTIDKITLEDYIEFHNIDFEILRGVYYNEGFNNTIGTVVKKLYDERMILKKTNPEVATLIKLILNSTYGKTIPKKSFEKVTYVSDKNYNKFVYKNYSNIKGYFYKVNDRQWEITTATTDDSYNLASVGIKCLSYSKRIMNEVMGVASDNDILICYQDTDSMHLKDAEIPKLEQLYTKKYPGRKSLHGNDMCQFKSDFKILDDNGDERKDVKNIKSIKSCFLAKKSYIDILQGEDINTNEKIDGEHIRLKGITNGGIQDAIERHGSAIELFEKLANGDKIEFVLNAKRAMFIFDSTKNGVKTHGEREHIRELQF